MPPEVRVQQYRRCTLYMPYSSASRCFSAAHLSPPNIVSDCISSSAPESRTLGTTLVKSSSDPTPPSLGPRNLELLVESPSDSIHSTPPCRPAQSLALIRTSKSHRTLVHSSSSDVSTVNGLSQCDSSLEDQSTADSEDTHLHDLVQNMAQSSVTEYEIGVLVAQALDKVGDLVSLSTKRVDMHAAIAAHSPQCLDMTVVQSALRPALVEAFEARTQQRPIRGDGANGGRLSTTRIIASTSNTAPTTTGSLTTHQLQELGATFGRDPSGLGGVVRAMWYYGECSPDVTTVVTRSSPLLIA